MARAQMGAGDAGRGSAEDAARLGAEGEADRDGVEVTTRSGAGEGTEAAGDAQGPPAGQAEEALTPEPPTIGGGGATMEVPTHAASTGVPPEVETRAEETPAMVAPTQEVSLVGMPEAGCRNGPRVVLALGHPRGLSWGTSGEWANPGSLWLSCIKC